MVLNRGGFTFFTSAAGGGGVGSLGGGTSSSSSSSSSSESSSSSSSSSSSISFPSGLPVASAINLPVHSPTPLIMEIKLAGLRPAAAARRRRVTRHLIWLCAVQRALKEPLDASIPCSRLASRRQEQGALIQEQLGRCLQSTPATAS